MADDAKLAIGSAQAVDFQNAIQAELARRQYDSDTVMAEYIAIMVINNKTEDQINAELVDLIPDYDPDFTRWLFKEAKPQAFGREPAPQPSAPSEPPSPSSPAVADPPPELRSAAAVPPPRGSDTRRDIPNQLGKRALRDIQGMNKSRKLDAGATPSAPRAMRGGGDGEMNGAGRSLLDRVGDRVVQPIETYDSGGSGYRDRQGGYRHNQNQNQQQQQQQPPPPFNVDQAALMDPATLQMQMMMMNQMGMGAMGMNPLAIQEMIGSNLAMMQQMANMMTMMQNQQQQQQQAPPQVAQNGTVAPSPASLNPSAPTFTPQPSLPPSKKFPLPSKFPSASVADIPPRPLSPTLCKHGAECANPRCRWSHPSPVSTTESGVVLSTEVCSKGEGGRDCEDKDCKESHISPAAKQLLKGQPSTVTATPSTTTTTTSVPAPTAAVKPPSTSQFNPSPGQTLCKFGSYCTRPNCHFYHPPSNLSTTPCKFGIKCTRANCPYQHPVGRPMPNHRGLGSAPGITGVGIGGGNKSMVFNTAKKAPAAPPAATVGVKEQPKEALEKKEEKTIVKEGVTV